MELKKTIKWFLIFSFCLLFTSWVQCESDSESDFLIRYDEDSLNPEEEEHAEMLTSDFLRSHSFRKDGKTALAQKKFDNLVQWVAEGPKRDMTPYYGHSFSRVEGGLDRKREQERERERKRDLERRDKRTRREQSMKRVIRLSKSDPLEGMRAERELEEKDNQRDRMETNRRREDEYQKVVKNSDAFGNPLEGVMSSVEHPYVQYVRNLKANKPLGNLPEGFDGFLSDPDMGHERRTERAEKAKLKPTKKTPKKTPKKTAKRTAKRTARRTAKRTARRTTRRTAKRTAKRTVKRTAKRKQPKRQPTQKRGGFANFLSKVVKVAKVVKTAAVKVAKVISKPKPKPLQTYAVTTGPDGEPQPEDTTTNEHPPVQHHTSERDDFGEGSETTSTTPIPAGQAEEEEMPEDL